MDAQFQVGRYRSFGPACLLGVLLGVLLALLGAANGVQASVVLQRSVAQMWAGSELVFDGQVIEQWSEQDPANGSIYTWLRFKVFDVVKGNFAQSTLDLRFLGGTYGAFSEEISGLVLPPIGERGIYFVESIQHFQVNPLFGWDQGRLRIIRDAVGKERVVSADGQPVLGIGQALRVPGAALSRGVADGVLVDPNAPLSHATSPTLFKKQLRNLSGGTR